MFVHLQVYSCYNFQNSTILISNLVDFAKKSEMESLALTDTNTMYGALEFNKACIKQGIKPIFGMETSVSIDDEIYPLLLLAKNNQGYLSLVEISSIISTSENSSIVLEELKKYADNIFVLSSSSKGIIERLVLKEMEDLASTYIKRFKELFNESFYISIQDHNIAMQKIINDKLIALATLHRVKVCCSNEVRYINRSDALTLDLLQASKNNQKLDLFYEVMTDQKYLKNSFEMEQLFSEELIKNTNSIARQCNVSLTQQKMSLPTFPTPENIKSSEYLKQLCILGLKKRRHGNVDNKYIERLQEELSIIMEMGFEDYFLIVFDYVRYAKKNGIIVGPGRGSAAGSLVSYVLGITNIDPIEYDLLFERFLNVERISMPDIDIDFQDDRRDEVVDYVINKYGKDYVGQIITFSTYGPKVAIRDLSKVMDVSQVKIDLLSRLIPTNLKERKSISEMYQTSYNFQSMVNKEPGFKKIIASLPLIEKLPRNISTHAAGIVLSKDPLYKVVPVISNNQHLVVQYSKDYIEETGLLKMDFLGLKNLTIINTVCKLIKEKEKDFSIQNIPLDDKKTYQMIANGDTFGVFQLESAGMKALLKRMQCDSLDDVIAAIALFRPGPMENIPLYIARKQGKQTIEYPLQDIKSIVESTYGILIYQEQIMQVARIVGGFSLAKADILRKAMSKKEHSIMESMKQEFLNGGIANGYPKQKVEEIYNLIEKFANYGFNKSHSVAYGYIAYQLAYLKANYPLAFFSAILTNEQGSQNTKAECIQECKKYEVTILPPSINKSYDYFIVEETNIRYSLLAIKNVGYAGYQSILKEREKCLFTSFSDFLKRMQSTNITSLMIESLIDAGCFDEFGQSRATLKANISVFYEYCELLEMGIDEPPILKIVKDITMDKLEKERAVLGVYLTMHPLEVVKQKLQQPIVPVVHINKYINQRIDILVYLQRVKQIVDKKGNDMCFIEGYDETGEVEGVIFSSSFSKISKAMHRGNICLLRVRVSKKDKLSVIVDDARVIV